MLRASSPEYVASPYSFEGSGFCEKALHNCRDRIRRSSRESRERAGEYLERLRREPEKPVQRKLRKKMLQSG